MERRTNPVEPRRSGVRCDQCGYDFAIDEEYYVCCETGEWLCNMCLDCNEYDVYIMDEETARDLLMR